MEDFLGLNGEKNVLDGLSEARSVISPFVSVFPVWSVDLGAFLLCIRSLWVL